MSKSAQDFTNLALIVADFLGRTRTGEIEWDTLPTDVKYYLARGIEIIQNNEMDVKIDDLPDYGQQAFARVIELAPNGSGIIREYITDAPDDEAADVAQD